MENFKIIEEKENLLFNRREIKASIEAEVTPSHADVEKLICEKFSTQTENIKVKKILGKFGSKTFIITANIYASREDLEKTEPMSKKEKSNESAQEQPKPVIEESIKEETNREVKGVESVQEKTEQEIKPVGESKIEEKDSEKKQEASAKQEEVKEIKPTKQKTEEIPEEESKKEIKQGEEKR